MVNFGAIFHLSVLVFLGDCDLALSGRMWLGNFGAIVVWRFQGHCDLAISGRM